MNWFSVVCSPACLLYTSKQDNMFGTLQLGYNPNRERVFLFANMKTSRYDTVARCV